MTATLHTLSNGVPVIIDKTPDLQTARVGFYFQVGARFENEKENGIAHFLEHMAFKGTKTRTARQINVELERLGAKPNAYTSYASTCFHVSGMAEDTPKFIEILNDIVQNSTLPKDELEVERGAILEEIGMYNDDADSVLSDISTAIEYPGQPLGRTILGPAENIRTFTRAQLKAFMDKHYHAGNLVVSVIGNVDEQQVLANLEKTVGTMPRRAKSSFNTASYVGGHTHEEKPLEQLRLSMSFPGYTRHDPQYWSARVLETILGKGMSSRLFEEIREKRGLVYSVNAYNDSSADTGTFGIYAGTGPDKVDVLMPVLLAELKKIREQPVSEEELERAKRQILVSMSLSEENMGARMNNILQYFQMFGKLPDPQKLRAELDQVTSQSVQEAARKIFAGIPTLASVGPGHKMLPYEQVVEELRV
jgi:predicted Zn-dependent peptidase